MKSDSNNSMKTTGAGGAGGAGGGMGGRVLDHVVGQVWMVRPELLLTMTRVLDERASMGVRMDAAAVRAIVDEGRNARSRADAERLSLLMMAESGSGNDNDDDENGVALDPLWKDSEFGEGGYINESTVDDRVLYARVGSVAVVSVFGMLTKYSELINGASQPRGTSAGTFARRMAAASADPKVKTILLDIDSPGGTVAGGESFVGAIQHARSKGKGLVAFANETMCSGAYLVASQCDVRLGAPAAQIGSIGVVCAVVDTSRAAEERGERVIVIASGEHKGAFIDGAPVKDAQVEEERRTIDAMHKWFVRHVADGLGVDVDALERIATGRVWVGAQAMDTDGEGFGLIDGVWDGTLVELVESLNAMHADPALSTSFSGPVAAGRAGVRSA